MISHNNLIKMAKKWQKFAFLRRKRIGTLQTITSNEHEDQCSSSPRAEKGHFVVYTVDKQWFMIRLTYLKNEIFKQLLEVAEEDFGMPRDGPIILPFNKIFMEQILCMIKKHAAMDIQKAINLSTSGHCSLYSPKVLDHH